MTVGDRIKRRRADLHLTQDEVASKVGTIKQTIYKYEQNKITNIPTDMIAAIAQALETTPAYLMGWDEPKKEEPVPVDSPRIRDLQEIDDGLNEEGHAGFVQYGKFLLTKKEYLQRGPRKPAVIQIRHYFTPPAAGFASPIEGEDYELMDLPEDAPRNADFCVTVSGHSMEPYIKDRQIVYVKRDESMEDFDVGVFFYDGDVYIKQFCIDFDSGFNLLSANPKYESANKRISKNSNSSLICFGKVLLPHKLPQPKYR